MLIALAHLMAMYAMTLGSVRDRRAGRADSGEEFFITLPKWVQAKPPPVSEPPRSPQIRSAEAATPQARVTRPSVPREPVPALLPAEPATIAADTGVPDLPDAAAIRAQARRDLGAIDKEVRGGAPLFSKRPESLQSKLEQGFAAANVGSSVAITDYYTAPDGVVYTRILRNGRFVCRISATVNFVPGILRDSEKSQGVTCPASDSGWHN